MILLENKPNQPSKLRIQNCGETNDDAYGTYNSNSQIEFKTTMLNSSLCDYSDAYIPVKGTIAITGGPADTDAAARQADERNKGPILKNCAPFTDCINKIDNTQADNAKALDLVMPMYNLIEYGNNYPKTSTSSESLF